MSALFCLAAANLAELTWHAGNMVELPNQTQQNIVPDPDLMGHPVQHLVLKRRPIERKASV